ncbi:hypothetical protein LCI18_008624 [Fusarium solani-melongenae]|uniref:Uncharacterized protein n=1 Tax=Fusarium solani subsp. cucurbitae TaxID=2747967 RepID=A0ACD3Z8S5_FUSSC|nr:hypothetical protein LCI18_008624 [Fusarium solani-melongenae]
MDECVRLEEALQAEELRKAEQEQSPRRLPVRRRSAWPFSLKDFEKTDEIRLPTVSPELAAFSPGPPEVSPRRRGTNPSPPCTPRGNDNRNDPPPSSPRSPRRQTKTPVEIHSSRSKIGPRKEPHVMYPRRPTSIPQSPTLPGTTSFTDLGRLQRIERLNRRSSSLIAPRMRTNTQDNPEEEHLTRPGNVAPAGGGTTSVVSEPVPLQILEKVDIPPDPKRHSRTFPHKKIEFSAVPKVCVPIKLNTDPPQHRRLVMMEIVTEFQERNDLKLYQVTTKLSYTAKPTVPGPKIAERATYSLREDPESGGEKELVMENKSGAADEFTLTGENFKSRKIVIHVALLLEQDQEEITKSFHARLGLQTSDRMLGPKADIELTFEPEDFGEHCERPVPKDVNLRELPLRWVGDERRVSTSL